MVEVYYLKDGGLDSHFSVFNSVKGSGSRCKGVEDRLEGPLAAGLVEEGGLWPERDLTLIGTQLMH